MPGKLSKAQPFKALCRVDAGFASSLDPPRKMNTRQSARPSSPDVVVVLCGASESARSLPIHDLPLSLTLVPANEALFTGVSDLQETAAFSEAKLLLSEKAADVGGSAFASSGSPETGAPTDQLRPNIHQTPMCVQTLAEDGNCESDFSWLHEPWSKLLA